MPKSQTHYVCQECAHESPRWLGRCPECGGWNSHVEEAAPKKTARVGPTPSDAAPVAISQVMAAQNSRLPTGIGELDRVLGGGLVPGSIVLVGGEPGIGKSTLMTQAAHCLSNAEGKSALYISGEESLHQIRLRADRMGCTSSGFLAMNETSVERIVQQIETLSPSAVIVDSVQTTHDSSLSSAPGTVSQVRDCAAAIIRTAKALGVPVFLIGHVTKEGSIAGPRVLEHMVDAVIYFEGDRHHAFRILRSVKNRFGSTDEIGVFEMREQGLVEVENPSAALLEERTSQSPGSCVTAALEGSRAVLVEVQALVTRSFLASPRRTANGIDQNRLHMLLAVLEKRLGLRLGEQDVYVNAAGGLKLTEPSVDLAITLAVASSFREQPIDSACIAVGEVGLSGEIRAAPQIERHLKEAQRMGFERAVVPVHGAPKSMQGMKLTRVSNVQEALSAALLPTQTR